MNRIDDIARFFKLYSLPLLTVIVAFGLYYTMFEVAHFLKSTPKSETFEPVAIKESSESTPKPESSAQNDIPLTLPEPEAPLPQEPHAPNLTQVSAPEPTPQPQEVRPQEIAQSQDESSAFFLRFIVNTDTLNIREAPSIDASVTAKKGRSEVLMVSEMKNEWARIPEGWAYIRLLRSGFDEPVRFIVNTDTLNIREAPSLGATIIAKKGRSEELMVSEIENEWGRIPQGWVYVRLITPAP
ncbi:MAG: SH3 domain-containing protein [Wolinella sp.]